MVVGSEGQLIDGRFELLSRLGGGGMGLVWRARDIALHREVALKEVRPPDPELLRQRPDAAEMLRKRVLREAISLAKVTHPNVVTIHHIVSSPEVDHPWLVMELVPGGSLQDRLDRGPCTPTETAQLGRGVLRALRAAHAAGILHRDVKPGNVLLREDGTPVLTDFGIAAVREATSLTNTGELIGSPDYMAPERLRGRDDDPSSDLWSLAMMLYVAVDGHHPMHRSSTLATLAAILEEDVPPPRRAGALGPVLRSVLVKDVAARPDAEALDLLLAEAAGERVRTVVAGPVAPGADARPAFGVNGRRRPDARPGDAAVADAETASGAGRSGEPGRSARTAPDGLRGEVTGEGPNSPQVGGGSGKGTVPGADATREDRAPRAARTRRRLALSAALAVLVTGVLVREHMPFGGDGDEASGRPAGGSTASSTPSGTPSSTPSPTLSRTPAPSPTPEKENLFTTAGARKVVREMKKAMGGTKGITFTLYDTYASAYVVSADGEVYDSFSYEKGKGIRGKGVGLMNGRPAFDAARVNWDALPRLIRIANTELDVRKPETSHISLSADFGPPQIRVFVTGEYGSASLTADFDGKITQRSMAS